MTSRELKSTKKQNKYVSTNGFLKAQTTLKESDVVILKGRYGTGKTTIALMVASYYVGKGYVQYEFDRPNIDTIKQALGTTKRCIIIVENIIGDMLQTTADFNQWKNAISFLFREKGKSKIILTTYSMNQELWKMIQNTIKCEDVFVDLDEEEALTIQDKTSILQTYSSKHQRNIYDSEIEEIVQCNTVFGFPLMCCLFCSNNKYFRIGKGYFTQIPMALLQKIETLKENGIDNDSEGVKFSVLVYIAISKGNHVSMHQSRIDFTMFQTIFKSVYKKEYTRDGTYLINAANSFRGQYLDCSETEMFTFTHPIIKRAVIVTYGKLCPQYVIEHSAVDDLLDIVRPESYSNLQNEPILQLNVHEDNHSFAKRIGFECFENETVARRIGIYVKEYGVCNNDLILLQSFLENLKEMTKTDKTKDQIAVIILIFQEITSNSNCVLPKELQPIDFRLSWELLCAVNANKEDTCIKLIQFCLDFGLQDEILFLIVDEFNNTLLHYLVIFNRYEGFKLLSKQNSQLALYKTNKSKHSPVHFAAHLARCSYLQELLQKHQKDTKLLKTIKTKLTGKGDGVKKDKAHFKNLLELMEDGENKRGLELLVVEQSLLTLNTTIVSSIKYGTHADYQSSKQILLDFYPFARKYLEKKGIDFSKDDNLYEEIFYSKT